MRRGPQARAARAAVMLLGALAAAGAAPGAPGGALHELHQEAVQLLQDNALRQKRLDLASSKDFHLVLDPNDGRLQLLLKNAILRDFKVLGVEVGYPEVAFRTRRPKGEWQGQVFGGGALNPPRPQDRLVVVAPPPSNEEQELPPPPIPPTPEEKYPVPSRFHVRFDGGVSIEVRTNEASPTVSLWTRLINGIQHWWRDARAAITGRPPDRVRIRLLMHPADAKSLYRALPPATSLLVVPKS